MLLIPFGTDAPVYHFPWGTIGLIVANVMVTLWSATHPEAAGSWILTYGDGLHPLQWVSSNFIHGYGGSPVDVGFHLLGNMVFLWGFGLVIEGKIGWRRFLGVYLGIGLVQCGLEQSVSLGIVRAAAEGSELPAGSFGASSVIYGLMAMALVWAPRNELTILVAGFVMRLFVFTFEVSILTFSLIYLGIEVAIAAVAGFYWGSEVLHLMGAALGFPLAVAMLKMGWVDCEDWDLFSVMTGRHLKTIAEDEDPVRWRNALQGMTVTGAIPSSVATSSHPAESESSDDERPARTVPPKSAIKRIRTLLEDGKPGAAYVEYVRLKGLLPEWTLDLADLRKLTQGLTKSRQWSDLVPLLEEQIARDPEGADRVRIRLAGIAVEIQKRPAFALRILEPVDRARLPAELAEMCRKIEKAANQLTEDGVIELEGRSWN